jgi:hypothetical protein
MYLAQSDMNLEELIINYVVDLADKVIPESPDFIYHFKMS